MTARIINHLGNVEELSDTAFYERLFGHPPKTAEEREAERKAWLIQRREESRRELEQLRDRLCEQASPELAARFRAQWALEDAECDSRRTTVVHSDPLLKRKYG